MNDFISGKISSQYRISWSYVFLPYKARWSAALCISRVVKSLIVTNCFDVRKSRDVVNTIFRSLFY